MNQQASLSQETDQQAADATEPWYQAKWVRRILVGVAIAAATGMMAWGWSKVEATREGAENGRAARDLAQENRKRIKTIDTHLRTVDHELDRTETKVMEKLDAIQGDIERNREEYLRNFKQLRTDIDRIRSEEPEWRANDRNQ